MIDDVFMNLLVGMIVVIIGGHFWYLRKRGRWLLLDPLNAFWGGIVSIFVMQPIAFHEVFVTWHTPEILRWTLVWTILSILAVIAGYESKWGRQIGQKMPRLRAHISPGLMNGFGWSLIILGLVGYEVLFQSAGGFWNWISVGRGATNYSIVTGYMAQLETLLPIGVMVLLYYSELHRPGMPVRVVIWFMAVMQWVWFVYLGSRSRTIGALLMLAAAWSLTRRRNVPLWLVGVGFALISVLVTFQARYRGHFTNLSFNSDTIDWKEARSVILPGWITGETKDIWDKLNRPAKGTEFNCVATIVELVPGQIDYNYGYPLLELFTRAIPHSMWAGKIYPNLVAAYPILSQGELSSGRIETDAGTFLSGPSFTFVGYWYAVGGPIGILMAGFLTGVFFQTLRSIYERSPGNHSDMILYSIMLPIGFGEAAATPLSWIWVMGPMLLPIALILWLMRERSGVMTDTTQAGSMGNWRTAPE